MGLIKLYAKDFFTTNAINTRDSIIANTTNKNEAIIYDSSQNFQLELPEKSGNMQVHSLEINSDIQVFSTQIQTNKDFVLWSNSDFEEACFYLGIVIDGKFDGAFDLKKTQNFTKHSLVFTKIKHYSGYMNLAKNQTFRTMGFKLSQNFIEEYLPNFKKNDNSIYTTSMNLKSQSLAQSIFYNPINTSLNKPLTKLKIHSQVLELIYLSLENYNSKQNNKNQVINLSQEDIKKLHLVKEMLDNSLTPYTLKDFVKLVGMNEFKLKTGFKKLFDQTIYQTSILNRMEVAKILLETSELSLGQIANKLGYKQQQNLTQNFKKVYGILPKDIRK